MSAKADLFESSSIDHKIKWLRPAIFGICYAEYEVTRGQQTWEAE